MKRILLAMILCQRIVGDVLFGQNGGADLIWSSVCVEENRYHRQG
jgi:hypothetical protein